MKAASSAWATSTFAMPSGHYIFRSGGGFARKPTLVDEEDVWLRLNGRAWYQVHPRREGQRHRVKAVARMVISRRGEDTPL